MKVSNRLYIVDIGIVCIMQWLIQVLTLTRIITLCMVAKRKLEKVLKATVRKRWNLDWMTDEGTAMSYRCEIDTTVVEEKQVIADPNGRWEHFKSNVIKAAEQTLGRKTREEVRKPWVTDEIIYMMEERRKWKSIHTRGRPQKI